MFRSWNTRRAIHYRDYYGISQDLGTAVTIMSMVYGNLGDTSGTGVLFTRNPSSGKKEDPRNSDGNPDSPQVVVFFGTIVDVTVGS